ncbi:MAG: enterotoxin, partial [Planctomycetes bacterium]|nr:enterotoxin [Planctomycetota bacterium]
MKNVVFGSLIFLWLVPVSTGTPILSPAYPGTDPGKARVSILGQTMTLGNRVLKAQWKMRQGKLEFESFMHCMHGDTVTGGKDLFKIALRDGRVIAPSVMTMTTAPDLHGLVPQPDARIAAQRTGGQALSAEWTHASTGLTVHWQAMLCHGSNTVRTELTLAASKSDIALADIILAELDVPGAKLAGEVKGSPIATDILFFAFEHPLADNSLTGNRALCHYPCRITLKPNQPKTYSAVMGTVPSGQMRRGFLYYLERERAHPYRPFLHYNSWYHLNIGRPNAHMTATELLDAVNAVGSELVTKRGVTLDAFVPDDGWDDFNTLWGFHNDFPNGFTDVARQATHYGAGLGVWMSPWGGYGEPKQARIKFGRAQGFETNQNGFSMAGPKYNTRFRTTCLNMIRDYGLSYFKFDGMGGGNFASGASDNLGDDVEAIFDLTGVLRQAQPELFINATVGTWPSPFWTRYADSIWRQGGDTGFAGVGNTREQWITYRDKYAYARIVKRAPLYPLNSLMFHGLTIGERANPGKMPLNEDSVRHEIRAMFGCGTGLQELYISPHLLTPPMWDDLAEAAKWSRRNTDVLVDTHWIGGDPNALDIYGWAAWCTRQGAI